jgi:hypothetical protein
MSTPAREILKLSRGYRRKAKYRNIPTTVDGKRFPSRAEARRWRELNLLELAGEISNLEYQPRYEFVVNGTRVGHYTGDSRYVEKGVTVVEDVKSKASRTEAYQLRKRLMRAIHGIDIVEVS